VKFQLTQKRIEKDLDVLAGRDKVLARALIEVGYPQARRRDHGLQTMIHIIVGQQLSIKAAATITGRLHGLLGEVIHPAEFIALEDKQLRAVGLSFQKIRYGRGLCEKVLSGDFDAEALKRMSNEDAVESITALLGFGRWSAEMYLMFSLGRTDIWPADDLAVQEAVRRFLGLEERPKQKQMDAIGEQWRPHRSAAALFFWHYYKKAPEV
jgi:DNA-3-methyladenine glycosylase II